MRPDGPTAAEPAEEPVPDCATAEAQAELRSLEACTFGTWTLLVAATGAANNASDVASTLEFDPFEQRQQFKDFRIDPFEQQADAQIANQLHPGFSKTGLHTLTVPESSVDHWARKTNSPCRSEHSRSPTSRSPLEQGLRPPSPSKLQEDLEASRQECLADFHKKVRSRTRSLVKELGGPTVDEKVSECLKKRRAEGQAGESLRREKLAQAIMRGRQQTASVATDRPMSAPLAASTRKPSLNEVSWKQRLAEKRQLARELHQQAKQEFRSMCESASGRPLLMEDIPRREDHYSLLGLDESASASEIKARYEVLSSSKECSDTLTQQKLEVALKVLSDPWQRQAYDLELSGKWKPVRNASMDRLQTELSEKAEQKRQAMQEEERRQRRLLREVCERGRRRPPLAYRANIGSNRKSLNDLASDRHWTTSSAALLALPAPPVESTSALEQAYVGGGSAGRGLRRSASARPAPAQSSARELAVATRPSGDVVLHHLLQ
mmetsp:Transcript_97736/g.193515  ORF Transcript_97736/g.193515 Transcript_97736/m.193515 type:complete len:494 (+) Transcript_97736:42-1523(+)|eukprot:CAMPEP_0172669508 /NCGR_PEP_ID=MMETSP1074-20121228/9717_1 /TAXON_ID=2916 /ORGANISM="Ceratium fusus, Strain PA161109" /LENGTH=493 /DNA_ID=CAMNT_0013486291 /DNA_START=32 /DNA_END=1513 /DNA_ORIENTATION=+